MNYPLVTVEVNNLTAKADRIVVVYVGDRNIPLRFMFVTPQYKLTKADEDNLLLLTGAATYEFTIVKQDKSQTIIGAISTIEDDMATYTLNEAFTLEGNEGAYDYQITLRDTIGMTLLTLPPVIGGLHVKRKL